MFVNAPYANATKKQSVKDNGVTEETYLSTISYPIPNQSIKLFHDGLSLGVSIVPRPQSQSPIYPTSSQSWFEIEFYSTGNYPLDTDELPSVKIRVEYALEEGILPSGLAYGVNITDCESVFSRVEGREVGEGDGEINPYDIVGPAEIINPKNYSGMNVSYSSLSWETIPDLLIGNSFVYKIRYPDTPTRHAFSVGAIRCLPENESFFDFDIAGNQEIGAINSTFYTNNHGIYYAFSKTRFGVKFPNAISSLNFIFKPDGSWLFAFKDWLDGKCKLWTPNLEFRPTFNLSDTMNIFSDPEIRYLCVILLKTGQLAATGVVFNRDFGVKKGSVKILFKRQKPDDSWPEDSEAVEVINTGEKFFSTRAILMEMPTGELQVFAGYIWLQGNRQILFRSVDGGANWNEVTP